MEFLVDYLGFLAKTATVVVGLLVVVFAAVGVAAQRAMRRPPVGYIEVERLNDRLQDMGRAVTEAGMAPAAVRRQRKRDAKTRKRRRREEASRRVFVLNFNGDIEANAVEALRREVSAVLAAAKDRTLSGGARGACPSQEGDEVVVRVDSAGGMVHGYGLAASQLARVRDHGLQLTVAVDKVAASGGYMMAAVASRILAAPFAVVGSIGVMAQIPNVHRLLKRHAVDVEVHTAGRFKRTLDVLGENTEEGRAKLREELRDAHALFQEFVGTWRPKVDMPAVSTGEAWYGQRALDRALVDELTTSDEYLARACEKADVLEVTWVTPKPPIERLFGEMSRAAAAAVERVVDRALGGTAKGDMR